MNQRDTVRHLTDSILPIDWKSVCMKFVFLDIVWLYAIQPYETLRGYLITGLESLG